MHKIKYLNHDYYVTINPMGFMTINVLVLVLLIHDGWVVRHIFLPPPLSLLKRKKNVALHVNFTCHVAVAGNDR